MKIVTSNSLEETRNIASEWLIGILKKYSNTEKAIVVGLSGHLGAGKTAFVKCVAGLIGVKEEVTSPTFVIMKMYAGGLEEVRPTPIQLVHIDAYRLERSEELEVLKFNDLIADKNNLIMIEWPENVGMMKFKIDCNLEFENLEGKYKITIK